MMSNAGLIFTTFGLPEVTMNLQRTKNGVGRHNKKLIPHAFKVYILVEYKNLAECNFREPASRHGFRITA